MYNSENRTISIRLVYVLLFIGMIVAAIVFITNKNSSTSSELIADAESVSSNQLTVASTTTSRSGSEIRTQVKENNAAEPKKENKTENKVENKTENKTKTESKAESKTKTEIKTESKSKTTKSSSKNSEKTDTKTEEKKNSKKDSTKKEENKKSTTKTTPISKVRISKTMDLTKRTGLSRSDFIKLISNVRADTSGFFEDNAGKIYDLCEKYSINEIFFCGLISAESGWNIASNHRRTHNYISLMSHGRLIKYNSVNEGLEVAARILHKNYLTPGGCFYHGKTLAGVKTCFCPSGTWVNLVYGRMQQIL